MRSTLAQELAENLPFTLVAGSLTGLAQGCLGRSLTLGVFGMVKNGRGEGGGRSGAIDQLAGVDAGQSSGGHLGQTLIERALASLFQVGQGGLGHGSPGRILVHAVTSRGGYSGQHPFGAVGFAFVDDAVQKALSDAAAILSFAGLDARYGLVAHLGERDAARGGVAGSQNRQSGAGHRTARLVAVGGGKGI